jgi:hypothetical protein
MLLLHLDWAGLTLKMRGHFANKLTYEHNC